ncbi:MAG: L-seryl-tRNA(Sec) selenium transferase [Desulfuromonadales bacterium]|nr:L-seryl-tRNA(Sec) selenium transferase [Desulfuromonadales bacterium]
MANLKTIPKVDKILSSPKIKELLEIYPRPLIVDAIRKVLDNTRKELINNEYDNSQIMTRIALDIEKSLSEINKPSLKRVINGTGVVIHTNLGRAPLPEKTRKQLCDISFNYSNLEYNLETGERGSRYSHVEPLICQLTGAEAAIVVNNNAAAILFALSAISSGKETIVSRGELVEIGGSFRIPDIMAISGTKLLEIGTTNRTHLKDYKNAISENTGAILKVHCSNFAMTGFTKETPVAKLAELSMKSGIPLIADLGSGNLIDFHDNPYLEGETVQGYIKAGVDILTCSGDKMIGGPQIGIIAGKQKYIETMKKHPLLRALRVDKMTLAALESVLKLYRDPKEALKTIPVRQMLTASEADLSKRGQKLLKLLNKELAKEFITCKIEEGFSRVGGGAMPNAQIPTKLISVSINGKSAQEIEELLRKAETPVIGRISKGLFLLDVRTIRDEEFGLLVDSLKSLK